MDKSHIVIEAEKLGVDCLYAERTHFVYSAFMRKISIVLSLASAIVAAIAGFGGISKLLSANYVAWIALLAAVLSGVHSVMRPGEVAKSHHLRGVGFAALRVRIRHFIHIECTEEVSQETQRERLNELTEQKIKLMSLEPATPTGRSYDKAKKGIRRGDADYEPAEILAAVGS